MTNIQSLVIEGKTVNDWDLEWAEVAGGLSHYQSNLKTKVGLFRFTLNGRISFIGKGVGLPGGLAKRLSDFRRLGASGRKHRAGRLIYENRDRLKVEVLVTGSDLRAQKVARWLRAPMIQLHSPDWNVRG